MSLLVFKSLGLFLISLLHFHSAFADFDGPNLLELEDRSLIDTCKQITDPQCLTKPKKSNLDVLALLQSTCKAKLQSPECSQLRENLSEKEIEDKFSTCTAEEVCQLKLFDPLRQFRGCGDGASQAFDQAGEALGSFIFDALNGKDPNAACENNPIVQKVLIQDFNKDLPACLHQKPDASVAGPRNCRQLGNLLHAMLKDKVDKFRLARTNDPTGKNPQDPCMAEWMEGEGREYVSIDQAWKNVTEKWENFGEALSKGLNDLSASLNCYKPAEIKKLICNGGTFVVMDMLLGQGKGSAFKVLKMAGKGEKKNSEFLKVLDQREDRIAAETKRKKEIIAQRRKRLAELKTDPQTEAAHSQRNKVLAMKDQTTTEAIALNRVYSSQLGSLVEKSGMKVKRIVSKEVGENEALANSLEKSMEGAPDFLLGTKKKKLAEARKAAKQAKPSSDFQIEIDLDADPMLKKLKENWGLDRLVISRELDDKTTRGVYRAQDKSIYLSPKVVLEVGGDLKSSSTLYHEIYHHIAAQRLKRNSPGEHPFVTGRVRDNVKQGAYSDTYALDELGAHRLSQALDERGFERGWSRFAESYSTPNLNSLSKRTIAAIDDVKKQQAWRRFRIADRNLVDIDYGDNRWVTINVDGIDKMDKPARVGAVRKRLEEIRAYAERAAKEADKVSEENNTEAARMLNMIFADTFLDPK